MSAAKTRSSASLARVAGSRRSTEGERETGRSPDQKREFRGGVAGVRTGAAPGASLAAWSATLASISLSAAYLQLEQASSAKHEFLDGQVGAMAGGSPEHAGIAANVAIQLERSSAISPAVSSSSTCAIRVKETGLGTSVPTSRSSAAAFSSSTRMTPSTTRSSTRASSSRCWSPSTEATTAARSSSLQACGLPVRRIVLVAHDGAPSRGGAATASRWSLEVVQGKGLRAWYPSDATWRSRRSTGIRSAARRGFPGAPDRGRANALGLEEHGRGRCAFSRDRDDGGVPGSCVRRRDADRLELGDGRIERCDGAGDGRGGRRAFARRVLRRSRG